MHPADRLEQPQVRPAGPGFGRDAQQHRRPRVPVLVQRVAEAGHQPPGGALGPDGALGDRVPARVIVRQRPVVGGQRGGQEPPAVLGHAEEP